MFWMFCMPRAPHWSSLECSGCRMSCGPSHIRRLVARAASASLQHEWMLGTHQRRGCLQVLALYGCLAWVQLSLRPDYILVIDCGSTGTRM